MAKYEIVFLLWGEKFRRLLTTFSLPSLLAAGNLPAWPFRAETTVVFHTTPADWEQLAGDPAVRAVAALVPVAWRPIQLEETAHAPPRPPQIPLKYYLMSQLHRAIVEQASQAGTSLVIATPDSVFSRDALTAIARRIDQGAEAIMCFGMRVWLEKAGPELLALATDGQLAVTPAQGADLIRRHLHPMLAGSFLDAPGFAHYPSTLFYWEGNSIVARSFHPHPLFLRHPRPLPPFGELVFKSIDGDYMQVYDDLRPAIVLASGEEFTLFTLSEAEETPAWFLKPDACERDKQALIQRFAHQFCTPIHRWFFGHPLRFSSGRPEGDRTGNRPAFFEAVEWVWELESLFQAQDWPRLRASFQQHGSLLEQLQDPSLFHGFYLIAAALYAGCEWDALVTFTSRYRSQLTQWTTGYQSYPARRLLFGEMDACIGRLPLPGLEPGGYDLCLGVDGQIQVEQDGATILWAAGTATPYAEIALAMRARRVSLAAPFASRWHEVVLFCLTRGHPGLSPGGCASGDARPAPGCP